MGCRSQILQYSVLVHRLFSVFVIAVAALIAVLIGVSILMSVLLP